MEVVKVIEEFISQYDELVDEYESLEMYIEVCENMADTIFYNILELQMAVTKADYYKIDTLVKVIKCLLDGFSFHLKDAKLTRVN